MRRSSSYGKLISYCEEYLCTVYGILVLDGNEAVASYQGGAGVWGIRNPLVVLPSQALYFNPRCAYA